MAKLNSEVLADSYRNPFADYNANVMDVAEILSYWCDPFSTFGGLDNLTSSDIFAQKNPIIFLGGRGSGKTMFLRYWSGSVQLAKLDDEGANALETLQEAKGIGAYIRIDGPALRSFQGSGLSREAWAAIFEHYFELVVSRECIYLLDALFARVDVLVKRDIANFWTTVAAEFGIETGHDSRAELLGRLDLLIDEVTEYRAEVPFTGRGFVPSKSLTLNQIVSKLPAYMNELLPNECSPLNLVILLDEYENFSESQQRSVNALLKFPQPNVLYRIGMRLEGFRTYDTVSPEDFIKEGRDYLTVTFEDFLSSKAKYQEYLKRIAEKRLRAVPCFSDQNLTDITVFLGKRESLEDEAASIASDGSTKMFHHYRKWIPDGAKAKLGGFNQPLVEMLGILWLLRGVQLDEVAETIQEYCASEKTERTKKFQFDLVDKYKLSLTILLASIYKTNKSYYSFNTFSYLSSGIVGHFLELCRLSFRHAEFEDRNSLLVGSISREVQSKAARDCAARELRQVRRIEDHGTKIYQLASNLGNIFRAYHLDHFLRYPETNQFSLDQNNLGEEFGNAFEAGLKWSVIQRKPKLQSGSPGAERTEIYLLNHIFAPQFDLSYRTRGGVNENYSPENVRKLMTERHITPKRDLKQRYRDHADSLKQQKLDI